LINKELGDQGESLVARFLEDRDFVILALNYRTRLGEVDIIAQKDDLLVFVEVKTRRHAYFPINMVVTRGKQKKIIKAAKKFLLENRVVDKICRFDVATVLYEADGGHQVDYIENAFMGV
jgi:putative endonuclease